MNRAGPKPENREQADRPGRWRESSVEIVTQRQLYRYACRVDRVGYQADRRVRQAARHRQEVGRAADVSHLADPRNEALALADAIRNVKENVRYCRNCYNLAEEDECAICRDPQPATATLLCVVEQPRDLMALEQAGTYRGLYHVLLGRIAPLDGIGPEQLTIDALVERVRDGSVQGSDHGHQSDGGRRRHGAATSRTCLAEFAGANHPAGPGNHHRQRARIC